MTVTITKRSSAFIIWWAIGVHLVWGVALIADPSVGPAAILVGLHWLITLGFGGSVLGLTLIVAAGLAAGGLLSGHRITRRRALLLLLPQYMLLVAAFVSDAQSVFTGLVGEREVDRLVLFTALWPVMFAAILHSVAIVERHLQWIQR